MPRAPTSCAPWSIRPPQCVVLDLRMPHVSGFDVQRALKQANAQVPVVIITGDDSPESRADALAPGRQGLLAQTGGRRDADRRDPDRDPLEPDSGGVG